MARTTDRGGRSFDRPDPQRAELARHLAAAVELVGSSFRLTAKLPRRRKLLAPIALAMLLTACEHDRYADRRDQVTFGSGDAVAANRAMHIIDPWPGAARTIEHGMSGEQAEAAMERLRKRNTAAEAAPQPQLLTLSPAPAAPKP